jgi:predicted phage tail protein
VHLIRLILHGVLKDRYESFAVAASTPAEAIEGWSRQAGADRTIVMQAVGFDTVEKLNDKTDATEVHLIPAMFGGGGAFGKILIGAVLIGLSFIPGIGQAAQIALMSAGIGMALGGVMQLFMKQPTVSKSEDPPASKYISSGKNTTAIGTPIGFGGGRMMIGGQFMSIQVNSSDLVFGTFPDTPT